MGSPGLGVSEADSKMRALAFVLLAAAAINAEAEADAYTIGQLAYDLTNSGVITGVDYNNGVVSGYGAIGHHPITHVAGVHPINTVSGVYNVHHTVVTPAVPSLYSNVYTGGFGKREAVGAYGKREVGWCYRKREAGGVYRKREVGWCYGDVDGGLYGK